MQQQQKPTRQERRAAERAAAKAARSQQRVQQNQPTPAPAPIHEALPTAHFTDKAKIVIKTEIGTAPTFSAPVEYDESAGSTSPAPEPKSLSAAQLAANRANAQLSTGPTSAAGREKVSRNGTRHGLAGEFQVLPGEDRQQFDELRISLHTEHKPTNLTEERFIESMAQHFWLMQRAIHLQDMLINRPELDHKTFSLYLRYQTTHERSYYKARHELQNARKEAAKQQIGFASQKRQQELHEAKVRLANARAAESEVETEVRATMEIPLPGHTRIPFEDLKDAFTATLRDLNHKLESKLGANAA